MQRTGPATADLTPAQWTSGGGPDPAAENKRLAQEGFREVISVQTWPLRDLNSSSHWDTGLPEGGGTVVSLVTVAQFPRR